MGLELLSWNYPEQQGLKELIPNLGLEPITVLSSLKKAEHRLLLERGVLALRDLKHGKARRGLELDAARQRKLDREIAAIEAAREQSPRAAS